MKIDSLYTSIDIASKAREWNKAIAQADLLSDLAKQNFGEISAEFADACYKKSTIYLNQSLFSEAEKLMLKSVAIREMILNEGHPDFALGYLNLGILYWKSGQYEQSEKNIWKATGLREKYLGKEHSEYAKCLNNLGVLYYDMGQYEKSIGYYQEALSIRKRVLGPDHPSYAYSLYNLAILFSGMGQFDQSEIYHLEAATIRGRVLGKNHTDYAKSLNSLGVLYGEMGLREQAEKNLKNAIAILKNSLGSEHPDYANSLNNLGILYWKFGQLDSAEICFMETFSIRIKALGTEHPDYANSLNVLGNFYGDKKQFELAEKYYLEAIEKRVKLLGKEHPLVASSYNNLGVLYRKMSLYDKSEEYLLQSMEIREKVLGKDHPHYASTLESLADLCINKSQFKRAQLYLTELANLNQSFLQRAQHHLPESEMKKYLSKFVLQMNVFFSIATKHHSGEYNSMLANQAIFYKGFLLEAANRLNKIASANSETKELCNVLKAYHRRLSNLYSKPLADRKGIDELLAKVQDLEKELTRKVAGYNNEIRQVNWQEINTNLKPNETVVEFFHYQDSEKQKSDSSYYAAIVFKQGFTYPIFISLFEEHKLLELFRQNQKGQNISEVYANRGVSPIKEESLQGIYDVIWKPLDSILKNINTIYYSPSGLLHRINFDAIPINNSTHLADNYKLVRLGSTRSIVVPDNPKIEANNTVILYGGINYNIDTTMYVFDSFSKDILTSLDDELSFASIDRSLGNRGNAWMYLPGTAKEIQTLSIIFKKSNFNTIVYSDTHATEEIFKNIGKKESSPRVLHISTHGFFFEDPKNNSHQSEINSQKLEVNSHQSKVNSQKSKVNSQKLEVNSQKLEVNSQKLEVNSQQSKVNSQKSKVNSQKLEVNSQKSKVNSQKLEVNSQTENAFKISDHPMIRSGLILTGGNYAWTNGKPYREGIEDGILTAYEISQLNLSNTELVVLSACETGLGDIQGNEGVYGLQRAFKIAGAKYLMMSLWQVPDEETKEFMIRFYQNWLEQKLEIPDAFRKTQQEMRKQYADPYKWAGFVLVE
ncbi:MAG: tetratricopeptide repeat protein [Saprospiraceae bacterium]|nr:tetratricopeptide repeat protein [Saprospiraceae bacterium]